MEYGWVIGVLLSLGASFLSTLGILSQKKSNDIHNKVLSRIVWGCGLSGMIIGALGDLAAFGFAAQSLLAPLGGSTIVFNALMSPCFLNEKLYNTDIYATVIILIGCTVTVAFGDQSEQKFSVEELFGYYMRGDVIMYFICSGAVIVTLIAVLQYMESDWREHLKTLPSDPPPVQEVMSEKKDSDGTTQLRESRSSDVSCTDWHSNPLTDNEAPPWYDVSKKVQKVGDSMFIHAPPLSTLPIKTPRGGTLSRQNSVSRPNSPRDADGSTSPQSTRSLGGMDSSSQLELNVAGSLPRPRSRSASPHSGTNSPSTPVGIAFTEANQNPELTIDTFEIETSSDGKAGVLPAETPHGDESGHKILVDFIDPELRTLHGFLYSSLGGIVGSPSVLFGKTLAELLKTPGDALTSYQMYLILICMVCTLLLQLRYLNMGLAYHAALLVVPIYQSFWVIGSIIAGGVYFKEFAAFDLLGGSMFCLGVIIALSGIYVLTYFRKNSETEAEEQGLSPSVGGDDLQVRE